MSRLTAAQLLELDILSNEQSGDDSGDDLEFDNVEIDFRNEDGESEEEGTDEDVVGTGSIKKDFKNKKENTFLYGGINKKTHNLLNGMFTLTKYLLKRI